MSEQQTNPQIYLFQDVKEVEHVLQQFTPNTSCFQSVAWNSSALDGLKSVGQKYIYPNANWDNSFEASEFYDRQLKYRNWNILVDGIIAKHCSEVKRLSFDPFLHQMFANRGLFNIYFNDIEKLFQLSKMFPQSTFHIYQYGRDEFSPLSRIIELILEQKLWEIDIKVYKPTWKIGGTMVKQMIIPDWVNEMDLFNQNKILRYKAFLKNRFFNSGKFNTSYLNNVLLKVLNLVKNDKTKSKNILFLNNSFDTSSFIS